MPRMFCVPAQTVSGALGSMVRQKMGMASPELPARLRMPWLDGFHVLPPSVLMLTPLETSVTIR